MQKSRTRTFNKRTLRKFDRLHCRKNNTLRKQRHKHILQFVSSLIIPLVFGVFTIVTTFHQQKLAREQRLEDLNESRYQRQQEEEYQQKLTDKQYQDQLLVAYIKDIAKLLKESNGSLTNDKTTANIARVKALNILRQLDAERNVHIIRFLYEAGQLNSTSKERPLDLSTGEMQRVDFRDVAVNKEKLDFLSLTNVYFYNVTFAELQMKDNTFTNSKFHIANFSLSRLNDTKFSSAVLKHVNFSHSILEEINFEKTWLSNVDFFNATFSAFHFHAAMLKDINFKCVQFNSPTLFTTQNSNQAREIYKDFLRHNRKPFDDLNMRYSQHSLIRVNIRTSKARNTNFEQTTCIEGRFDRTDLSHSNFQNANLKHGSFAQTILDDTNFDGANLYKADLTNSTITDSQLQTAISIEGAILPDGTVANDKNLIKNGEAGCDVSVVENWILVKGSVNTSATNMSKDDCRFYSKSLVSGATIFQRVNLSCSWDSLLWPYSKAVLTALMSSNTFLTLRGLDSIGRVVMQATLNNTDDSVNIVLDNTMTELEVEINFIPVINRTNDNVPWCDNVRLFIIYGTHKELTRVMPNLPVNARWDPEGVTVAGGNGEGHGNNQLRHPLGIFVDDDNSPTILIADCGNNRIVQYTSASSSGQVVAGGNGQGNRLHQLGCPSDVLIDKETNSLIICDEARVVRWSRRNGTKQGEILVDDFECWGVAMDEWRNLYVPNTLKNEVRRYEIDRGDTIGTIVAGGNGKGSGLNQFSTGGYICIDKNQSLYVSDNSNHRVMKWDKGATEGVVVAGGLGQGESLIQLSYPNAIFVDALGTLYVIEEGNDRVTRWIQRSKQSTVIAGGIGLNHFNKPFGFSLSKRGHLYVADYWNHRVQRFNIIN